MKDTIEQQKNYDAMEKVPAHRDVEWNRRNREWYMNYTREYKGKLEGKSRK